MSASKKGDQYRQKLKTQYEERKLARRIVFITLFVILTAMITVGIYGYSYLKTAVQPVDPNSDEITEIDIPLGSTVGMIGNILEENGIISNGKVFRYYVKFKNESDFQAGTYEFSPSMTLDEIIAALKTGKVLLDPVYVVTIPEGKTIEEMATLFATHTPVSEDEFLDKVNNTDYIEELIELYPTILSEEILHPDIRTPLEGYLFAATYDFYEENITVEDIVEKMLTKTEDIILPYVEQIGDMNWSVHELVTMASLIENEARDAEHRKRISGVFYNRLEASMPLQTDPTVLYALGVKKDRVLYEDLEVDSPYNTYKYAGLPVGPISNFAENSIEAAINPEPSNYYYFLASLDGEIYYAETYEKHLQLIEEHRR
ncbi:endolytic transglycosylase MltG [Salirhabdus salicampi]|uniref:endolytic transglycosylase MltG n=1 Tax=Salirhabdus salicampi TaxID=476102 RepID=UPI0020C23C3F|nr:endolytic transglycosylase MltG [Salirhabdus salicampi]MCP8616957.1 endolytic transglycosylase MltG [Salirhabdus salicampi]